MDFERLRHQPCMERPAAERGQDYHQPGRCLPEHQERERCQGQTEIGRRQDSAGPDRVVEGREQQTNDDRVDSQQRVTHRLIMMIPRT